MNFLRRQSVTQEIDTAYRTHFVFSVFCLSAYFSLTSTRFSLLLCSVIVAAWINMSSMYIAAPGMPSSVSARILWKISGELYVFMASVLYLNAQIEWQNLVT